MKKRHVKHLSREEVMWGLAQAGYELAQPSFAMQGEEFLLSLARQEDQRLLEGFPVVLVNLLRDKKHLEWEKEKVRFPKMLSAKYQVRFFYLVVLSYLLFKLFGEDNKSVVRVEKLLTLLKPDWRTRLTPMEEVFNHSGELEVDSRLTLSCDRLKTQYRNYAKSSPDQSSSNSEELAFELHLSRFFTPRQKELVRKRQKGELMTKTEKEYFYSVVSKRLKALADDRVHSLAKELVQSRG